MEDGITDAEYLAQTAEIEKEQDDVARAMAVDSSVVVTGESEGVTGEDGQYQEATARPTLRIKRKMVGDDDEMDPVESTKEDRAGDGLEGSGTGRRGPRVPMMTVPRRGLTKPMRKFVDVKALVSSCRDCLLHRV